MVEALPTLFFPFERGILEAPQDGQRTLLFGPSAGLHLPADFAGEIRIAQGFRPDYLALERSGVSISAQAEGKDFDSALLLLNRHRRENELHLAEALRRVRPGGLIAAAGTKKDGAPSIRKRMAELLPVEDSLSKHHGIVFWLRRPELLNPEIVGKLTGETPKTPEGFETAIGGFSQGAADPGSRLLADSLPPDITGTVADFAAGWGYLSLRLADRSSIGQIDLYEAHYPSLEAARRNLARHAPHVPCHFFWHDLLSEPVESRYDAIVMNPPFHRSRAAEPDVGRAMIEVAARALKSGGRLFLVANRPLPYEAVMEASFAHQREICRDAIYKVLCGRK